MGSKKSNIHEILFTRIVIDLFHTTFYFTQPVNANAYVKQIRITKQVPECNAGDVFDIQFRGYKLGQ